MKLFVLLWVCNWKYIYNWECRHPENVLGFSALPIKMRVRSYGIVINSKIHLRIC